MKTTPLEQRIMEIIAPSLTAMGFAIVQVKLGEGGNRMNLQVMAERTDDVMMTIEDCTEISHTVSALMDVEDPIKTAYQLEICSPGLDRPLITLADFMRFIGFEAKLETMLPIDGRKRFQGQIAKVDGETIQLITPDGEVAIMFQELRSAKLRPTEQQIRAIMKQRKDKIEG